MFDKLFNTNSLTPDLQVHFSCEPENLYSLHSNSCGILLLWLNSHVLLYPLGFVHPVFVQQLPVEVLHSRFRITTDETYSDAELARVSVLTLDITKTAYVSPVASIWQVS